MQFIDHKMKNLMKNIGEMHIDKEVNHRLLNFEDRIEKLDCLPEMLTWQPNTIQDIQ